MERIGLNQKVYKKLLGLILLSFLVLTLIAGMSTGQKNDTEIRSVRLTMSKKIVKIRQESPINTEKAFMKRGMDKSLFYSTLITFTLGVPYLCLVRYVKKH